jgi:hypothetical protein
MMKPQVGHDPLRLEAAKAAIHDFAGDFGGDYTCISLGQRCSSAWYLKEAGLKKESYPFDWVFSSTDIVLDCVADSFGKFLDKSLIEVLPDGQKAGHTVYHSTLFNHRSPLKSDADYQYYVRCCDRFMAQIASKANTLYLITLINEPHKRPGWAKGFDRDFQMPTQQSAATVRPLISALLMGNENSKFLILDPYTNQVPGVWYETISRHVLLVKFYAQGNTNGVFYPDKADDAAMKLILSGLC